MSSSQSAIQTDYFEGTYLVDEVLDGEKGYARGPERSLLSALLFDGIQAYFGYVASPQGAAAKRHREAFSWVNAHGRQYIFSFESVCEALGVDPEFLRLGLINAAKSINENRKKSRRTF